MRYSTKLSLLNNVNALVVITLYENKQKNNITLSVNKVTESQKLGYGNRGHWYYNIL